MTAETAGFMAVDRVVGIIDVVRDASPATLARIARATGLTETTALRYLTALRHHRIIRRDPQSGAYSLGMRLFEWGQSAQGAYDPRVIAAPLLDWLSDEHGETVELASYEPDDRLIVLDARPGRHGVSKLAHVGDVEEWHSTSVGKSLLAAMDPQDSAALVRRLKLRQFTDRTLTTVGALERDFVTIRARGYAVDDEESERGLRCVGVAARDRNGVPTFAISVSGPSYRMTDEALARISTSVQSAAAQLERAWGLDPDDDPNEPRTE